MEVNENKTKANTNENEIDILMNKISDLQNINPVDSLLNDKYFNNSNNNIWSYLKWRIIKIIIIIIILFIISLLYLFFSPSASVNHDTLIWVMSLLGILLVSIFIFILLGFVIAVPITYTICLYLIANRKIIIPNDMSKDINIRNMFHLPEFKTILFKMSVVIIPCLFYFTLWIYGNFFAK